MAFMEPWIQLSIAANWCHNRWFSFMSLFVQVAIALRWVFILYRFESFFGRSNIRWQLSGNVCNRVNFPSYLLSVLSYYCKYYCLTAFSYVATNMFLPSWDLLTTAFSSFNVCSSFRKIPKTEIKFNRKNIFPQSKHKIRKSNLIKKLFLKTFHVLTQHHKNMLQMTFVVDIAVKSKQNVEEEVFD